MFPPHAPQSTILVVDDDPATQVLIREIFGDAGLHVIAARTSAEALTILATRRVDLVLVDPPGRVAVAPAERWVVLDALRHAAADTPVALLTAHPPALFADFPAHGVAGLLAKPFDIDDLMTFVRCLLGLEAQP